MLRRRRKVRLHFERNEPSVEGIFVGFWANHYVLAVPAVVAGANQTVAFEGPRVRVPKERVTVMEELL